MSHPDKGFTLIELIVAISILALIATFSLSRFNSSTEHTKINTLSKEFIEQLNYANTLSIKSNQIVRIDFTLENKHITDIKLTGKTVPETLAKVTLNSRAKLRSNPIITTLIFHPKASTDVFQGNKKITVDNVQFLLEKSGLKKEISLYTQTKFIRHD